MKGGKRGPAVVPGQAKQSLLIRAVTHADETIKMPMGADKLKDEEIADILTYVRSSWGNDGDAVSVAEVASVRAKASH